MLWTVEIALLLFIFYFVFINSNNDIIIRINSYITVCNYAYMHVGMSICGLFYVAVFSLSKAK